MVFCCYSMQLTHSSLVLIALIVAPLTRSLAMHTARIRQGFVCYNAILRKQSTCASKHSPAPLLFVHFLLWLWQIHQQHLLHISAGSLLPHAVETQEHAHRTKQCVTLSLHLIRNIVSVWGYSSLLLSLIEAKEFRENCSLRQFEKSFKLIY